MLNYKKVLDASSKKYFDSLIELGYIYEGIATESMGIVKDYFVAKFSNKSKERKVEIIYHPPRDGVGDVISVDIVNTEKLEYDDFDYTSTDKFHFAILRLSEIEGTFESNSEIFLKKVSMDIIEKHKNMLLGKCWECTPIDWLGYK